MVFFLLSVYSLALIFVSGSRGLGIWSEEDLDDGDLQSPISSDLF